MTDAREDPTPGGLGIEDLRAERMRCRRALELAQMRARQASESSDDGLAELKARYAALTDALIEMYGADLSLVDLLLGDAYPRNVEATRTGARTETSP